MQIERPLVGIPRGAAFQVIRRMRSPGERTASNKSQERLSPAHGFMPSHAAQSSGIVVSVHSVGRVWLIRIATVPSAADLLEFGSQHLGVFEIVIPIFLTRRHLEDN